MFDSPFQETDRPYQQAYGPARCHRHGHGIVRTALMWTAIAVAAMLAFGTVTWAFGLVFHRAALLLRIAIVTAVIAFVWRRVTRRRGGGYDA